MERRPRTTLILLLAAAFAACGDDGPTDPGERDDFVGTFDASVFSFTPEGGAPFDAIAAGADLEVVVDSGHDFVWTLTFFGDPLTATGSLDVDEASGTVDLDFDGEFGGDFTADYTFSSGGDRLTLEADGVAFDLTGDGVDEVGDVRVVLERR